ncbi:MAG: propanediol dehydratase [Chloroflexi bacterium]|nr:propanediol dehydratase [Chloroflexota bacterium]
MPQVKPPQAFIDGNTGQPLARLAELEPAAAGTQAEVIVAVGPAFGTALTHTINGLSHESVLEAILTGIASEGMLARIIKVYHTADCGAIGYVGSRLSGSGIAIGLQSRGTTIIHKKGQPPLHNLELFPQSPSLTLETFQHIGRNAARYAKGASTTPVAVKIDNGARLRLIVKTTLMHRREIDEVREHQLPLELRFDWEPNE